MASFTIGGNNNENNFFEKIAKTQGSFVFTETFLAGELDKVRPDDKKKPLAYLKQGSSATVVVALPKEALAELGLSKAEDINGYTDHPKIVAAVNKYQQAEGGLLFEFRSLFNGQISPNNLVDEFGKFTTFIPDNGLHEMGCDKIKEGIEKGEIVSTYYNSIRRLKDGDSRPIRCYALASLVGNL